MDVFLLARLQFALTIAFHYIFPPFSIGLGLILVCMEGTYLATKKPLYHAMTRFWVRIFGLMFAIGVASGIVMEFQFGTNWSTYSRYVGDIFGSALAAEGIFAFFLESGFLALLLFGWDRISPKMHFFSTVMVSLGSIFSAVWIIVANSWQQTPAGYHLVQTAYGLRAEVVSFKDVLFNPSSINRLSHVLSAAFQTGAFLVISISAYYLIKGRHLEFARASLKIGLLMAMIAAPLQLLTGHTSAMGVARTQPAKLAAFEGHYPASAPAAMHLFGWVDDQNERVEFSIAVPGMLSWLISGDHTIAGYRPEGFHSRGSPPSEHRLPDLSSDGGYRHGAARHLHARRDRLGARHAAQPAGCCGSSSFPSASRNSLTSSDGCRQNWDASLGSFTACCARRMASPRLLVPARP